MKATGIVRRIDDLGRVVIPKEIRRTLRIREGDPLLTTLTDCKNPHKQPVFPDSREELFFSGIMGLASRLGISPSDNNHNPNLPTKPLSAKI